MIVFTLAGVGAFSVPSTRPTTIGARAPGAVMQFGFLNKGKDADLPKGWKRVASKSRPGDVSYEFKGKRYSSIPASARGKGDQFYDDEADTVSALPWSFKKQEDNLNGYRSVQEAAGFAENGGDLATFGGEVYLATVPFLLFGIFYLFGAIGSPYSSGGNF